MPIITTTVLNLLEEWFKHEFDLVEFKEHLYCVKYSHIHHYDYQYPGYF